MKIPALVTCFLIAGVVFAAEEDQTARRSQPTKSEWGEAKNGVHSRLTSKKQTFRAGEAVPIKIELENIADQAREYQTPGAPHNHSLIVVDEDGNDVPYLGGWSQVMVRPLSLAPGECREISSFDLAESFYLRRPGRYSVKWPGEFILHIDDNKEPPVSPASAPLEFDIVADELASADGDPVGRLLPLVQDKWVLAGGSSQPAKLNPGGNHSEVEGRLLDFQYNPTGYKVDAGIIWLWLTSEAANEQPATNDWPPVSEYLGKIDRWHVYYYASPNAARAWPNAKDEIMVVLGSEPQ